MGFNIIECLLGCCSNCPNDIIIALIILTNRLELVSGDLARPKCRLEGRKEGEDEENS